MNLQILRSRRGFSIMGAMIGIAISSIVVYFIVEIIEQQNKGSRSFLQKSETIEFKNIASQVLRSSGVCTWQLSKNSSGQPILLDTTAVNQNVDTSLKTVLKYDKVHTGDSSSSLILAQKASPLNIVGSKIVVKEISLSGIKYLGTGSEYISQLSFELDPSSTSYSFAPVKVTLILQLDLTNPAAAPIVGCYTQGEGDSSDDRSIIWY